jgi:hypothetical protein
MMTGFVETCSSIWQAWPDGNNIKELVHFIEMLHTVHNTARTDQVRMITFSVMWTARPPAVASQIRPKTSFFYFFNFYFKVAGHTFGELVMVQCCGWPHPTVVWSVKKWSHFETLLRFMALKIGQREEESRIIIYRYLHSTHIQLRVKPISDTKQNQNVPYAWKRKILTL